MLKNDIAQNVDLVSEKQRLAGMLPAELKDYISDDDSVTSLTYPVETFPKKCKSISLDKQPIFSGRLNGIKGQYLLLDEDRVFNVRKHTGYEVVLTIN